LTTTIQDKLEKQLDDRILSAHPDTSSGQTRKIIMRTAASAAGAQRFADEMTVEAWRHFHDSLMPASVIIPYASKIAEFLPEGNLPVSARRAFDRVIAVIKTITLLYQAQRRRDEYGRLIAEVPDYAMAIQFIEEIFTESLKNQQVHTEERIRIIDEAGMITLKALSETVRISKPAMSKWVDLRVQQGILTWCDAEGESFEDVCALIKAKKRGQAFICLANRQYLPTPFELSGDPRWDQGGEFYVMYDLHLEADGPVHDFEDGHVEKFKLLPHLPQVDDSKSESEDFTQLIMLPQDIDGSSEEVPENTVLH
jgi:DNA primase